MRGEENKRDEAGFYNILSRFFTRESRVELSGSRMMTAEGCTGVASYSDTTIRLSMGRQSLIICGSDLRITNMFGQTVCVSGRISSLEFV